MGWLRLVGSLKLYVSFAKEPYKRDYILQQRPVIVRSLLFVATPYVQCFKGIPLQHTATHCNILQHTATHCNRLHRTASLLPKESLQHTASHCITPTATHCNTLHRTASLLKNPHIKNILAFAVQT